MKLNLPLEVIGRIAPVLNLVEGWRKQGMLRMAQAKEAKNDPERQWLSMELPAYSRDNLRDIQKHGAPKSTNPRLWRWRRFGLEELIPAFPHMNLIPMFHYLGCRYFHWYGNSLMIKQNRVVEVHELSLRMPLTHVVLFSHAFAVAHQLISFRESMPLPDRFFEIESNSRGFKALIDRGLSETHLHLSGVLDADDVMADHLVVAGDAHVETNLPDSLLFLGRALLKAVILGTLHALVDKAPPRELLGLLDQGFQEQSPLANQRWRAGVRRALRQHTRSLVKDPVFLNKYLDKCRELLLYLLPEMSISRGERAGFLFEKVVDDPSAKYQFLRWALLSAQVQMLRRCKGLPAVHGEMEAKVVADSLPRGDARFNFLEGVYARFLVFHASFWQRATQSGPTTGLEQFKQFYASPFRKAFRYRTLEQRYATANRLGRFPALRKLEARVGPPFEKKLGLRSWVLALADQTIEGRLDKFGLIIHFIKMKSPSTKQQAGRRFSHLRYRHIREKVAEDADRLFRLLSQPNPIAPFIVGIDAANLELATPPEVFAPAFRFLREYPIRIKKSGRWFDRYRGSMAIAKVFPKNRLFMTYHVGEDFRHLLSGLRAIQEVIDYLKPLPGDRLGHAIALALSPRRWLDQVGNVAMTPKLEWLDNLVWIRHLLGAGHPLLVDLNIDDLIYRYARDIYGLHHPPVSPLPEALYDAWQLRQLDPQCFTIPDRSAAQPLKLLPLPSFPRSDHRWILVQKKALDSLTPRVRVTGAYTLLRDYWYEPRTLKMGAEIVSVDMGAKIGLWKTLLEEVQNKMLGRVIQEQLVVEANPSSNRVIGYLESLEDHHIFPLTLNENDNPRKELRVTVGSDNPGVCNTSIAHEYYMLGEILIRRGVPEPKVVEWLEWLRQNGEDFNFLTDYPTFDSVAVIDAFEKLIKNNAHQYFRLKGKKALHAYQKWVIYGKKENFNQFVNEHSYLFFKPRSKKVVETFAGRFSP